MAERRPRVVYWGSQPSPYVVERLDAVADAGEVDLEAWFDYEREADRSWRVDPTSWRFRARYLGRPGERPRVPWRELRATRPDLIVTLYDRPHALVGLLVARAVCGRVTVRCLPPAAVQSGRRTLAHDLGRRLVFRTIDGAKVPGPDGRTFAVANGLDAGRTWVVTQSVDVDRYGAAADVEPARRAELRARFGVDGCVFLYAGRLIAAKGVFELLDAFARVAADHPEATLLVAGDGADEAALRERATGLRGVVFTGFLQPEQLPDALAAADVFVFPTLGDPHGLVAQEAMAAGLPVVATTAANDIGQRITDGVSGLVVPAGDVDALAVAMAGLAGDPSRRRAIGTAARAAAERYRHPAYAADFATFVRGVLAAPPRATVPARALRALGRRRPARAVGGPPRVVLVGPSFRFASGLSAYTHRLAHALAEVTPTSVVLLRRLVPARLYPGRAHVGADLASPAYDLPTYDGIDWWWGSTIARALRFVRAARPDVVVLQWWTVATAHTSIALAFAARAAGAAVVVEFHEVQDPSEARLGAAVAANRLALRALTRLASGAIVHNRHDAALVAAAVDLRRLPVEVVTHGPVGYGTPTPARPAGGRPTRLLFFGLIRPYKGLDDLIAAFDGLGADEAAGFELVVVGETWQGYTAPAEAIAASPHRDRITFVNRYVRDDEVARHFAEADVLVLPYRRASASGPLSIALAAGLPVIAYDVPQLLDEAAGYKGLVAVPGGDVGALRDAIRAAPALAGRRFATPTTWDDVAARYVGLLEGWVRR